MNGKRIMDIEVLRAIAVVELNYRLIEMPMRNREIASVKRFGMPPTAIPSSGATSC